MVDEAELVALGGLLHDIGKFKQRGSSQKKKHQEFGYEFLKKYSDRYLKEFDSLPLFAKFHHRSDLYAFSGDIRVKNLLTIVCEADNISSGERREFDDYDSFKVENPLESVFSSVNLGKGKAEKCYYPLRVFSSKSYFHPEKIAKNSQGDYRDLFEKFENEFEIAIRHSSFNALLHTLEKYTTFVPAMLTENNDISLYDHLKTTSAIAICIYYYHRSELDRDIRREIENRKEKKYLVVGGDISGIQDFIYTITSKGALKYLRARSLFLELMVEDVVAEIIHRLGLTRANIIFSGGGRFYILAYNTEEAKNQIAEIAKRVNRWLFDNFWGKLYFAIEWVEISGEELSKFRSEGKSIWELINRKLKVRKLRKFLDVAGEGDLIENYIPDSGNFGECDVCKVPAVLRDVEDVKVCQNCGEFLVMGKEILKADGFIRLKETDEEIKYSLPFSCFVPVRIGELSDYPEDSEIYVRDIEAAGIEIAAKFNLIPISIGRYYARRDDGSVKEFDELAKCATGAKKLAVLRMDVDDLGKVFSIGLKDNETISRMATLSRFINHFFKNCIDLICAGEERGDAPRIKGKKQKKDVVVVYAGGDDLFIVGAWDDVFELTFEIQDLFRKYVGENPNITISAGYAIFDPKFPLYRMAEITGKREETAKDEGVEIGKIAINGGELEIKAKGRIYLMDRFLKDKERKWGFKESYTWEEFRRVWKEYIPKIYDESKVKLKIPRGVLWKILDARREYLKNVKGFKWQILLIYYLSRVRSGSNGKRLIEEISGLAERDFQKIERGEPLDIFYIDVPLKIVDFAVRGGVREPEGGV